jgi:hypothetical protein
MPGINVRVEVLLCPHRSHLTTKAGSSWPRLAKAQVLLTDDKGDTVDLGETDDKGVTRLSGQLELGTYRVEVPGYDFEAKDLTLTRADANKQKEVRLVSRDDRWLVRLSFTEQPAGAELEGASVKITSSDGVFSETFTSDEEGNAYAYVPAGDLTLEFAPLILAYGPPLIASDTAVQKKVEPSEIVPVISIDYWPAIQISAEPTVKTSGGTVPLTGAYVTVEYRGSARFASSLETKSLDPGSDTVSFDYPFPGLYVVTVTPPPDYDGLPIKNGQAQRATRDLSPGEPWAVPAEFEVVATKEIKFLIKTPENRPLAADLQLQVIGPSNVKIPVTGTPPDFTTDLPSDGDLEIQLDPGAIPTIAPTLPGLGDIPLVMSAQGQNVVPPPGTNTIVLQYQHSITVQAVDERGRTVSGAMIDIFDEGQKGVGTVITGANGSYVLGLPRAGTFFLAPHQEGGGVGIRERVEVHSNAIAQVEVQTGTGRGAPGGEALIDLAAYPVLTEEITTTGVPAPSAGGPAARGPSGGYGQAVDQVIRDVLGWRPGGDVTGFQAALAGAFQLREVQGHTEWSWQQRGYAVQADLGALTGAQASIYARAKSALDQILPLLAGLTSLNPALYPPQDLEAIRIVVSTELQELVSELALEGGPRIQRVDELFGLLLGARRSDRNLNPDRVDGQLGTLRDRFGLTVDQVNTLDEERIITNFRVVVDQVLALNASWLTDRNLFSQVTAETSFGTVLILLSRSLEAVGESVDELTFALDSVFLDAAQRQVIELRFAHLSFNVPRLPLSAGGETPYRFGKEEPPILLSDLLDWVLRASRDEGRRIIQDAGKDGVVAFAPMLDKLRVLIHATRKLSHEGGPLPHGMRTPRVRRALKELADQLDEATDLARSVQRQEPPEISAAVEADLVGEVLRLQCPPAVASYEVCLVLLGRNFRDYATTALTAEGRPDLGEVRGKVKVAGPSLAFASFKDPRPDHLGITWLVSLTNSDGTHSNEVEALRPRHID